LYDERKALEGAEREEMDRRIDQLQDRVYSPDVRTANRVVIPSKPSEIGQIMRGIAEAVEQIKKIDFEAISDNINEVLNEVHGKVADANIRGISDGVIESLDRVKELLDKEKIDRILAASEEAAHALNKLLDDADRAVNRVEATVNRVDGIVASKEAAIKAAVDGFQKAIGNANDVLEKGKALIGNTDGSLGYLSRSLMVTAQNLERASDNLNRTLEKVSNQPSQLLFGQPPPRREVEQDMQQQ
jgi:phospholipid/cholesterol/gamma-HCH transport system substrate-binding protein